MIKTMSLNLGDDGFGTVDGVPIFHVNVELWSKMGSGITLSEGIKTGKPTLFKRIYDYEEWTSKPFKTTKDFGEFKRAYTKRMD